MKGTALGRAFASQNRSPIPVFFMEGSSFPFEEVEYRNGKVLKLNRFFKVLDSISICLSWMGKRDI